MSSSTERGGMGGGLVPGSYPSPEAMRPTLVGESWSVVAGHPQTAQVAAKIFEAGGNAVDAGVAAGIASNVVQVDMANFGGIAPILVRPANSAVAYSVAGIGRWSRSASLSQLLERYGGKLPLEGAPAIVPGAPAGWIRALSEFGSMSLAEVAQPAIDLAKQGFIVDRRLAESLEITGRRYTKWETSAAIYQPQGRPLVEGDRLQQVALGELLEKLVAAEMARGGSRIDGLQAAHLAFYSGEIARCIADTVTDRGGYMTVEDLAEFEAEVSTAPQIRFGAWQMFATPSWSQGPVALEILGLFERSGRTLHDLVESISLAFNDREDFFSSPDSMERDIAEFLSDDYLSALASSITDNAVAGRGAGAGSENGSNLGSTTSVVTMDASGCTFATSPSDTLDGGPIIQELGIICSPRGVQTRLDQSHPNRMRPWGRPMVTPAALIGVNGSDSWALACPGGDVIVQAIAQVAINMNAGLSPQEAVEAPRIAAFNAPSAFHPHPTADRLVYAEGRIAEADIQKLASRGHNVELWPDFEFDAGSVQTIVSRTNHQGERFLLSGADPRRSAYAQSR